MKAYLKVTSQFHVMSSWRKIEVGDIELYWVRITTGGHKQIEGVNYTETLLATAKMPSVHVVLGNAATQDWEIHKVNINSVCTLTHLLKGPSTWNCPEESLNQTKRGRFAACWRVLMGSNRQVEDGIKKFLRSSSMTWDSNIQQSNIQYFTGVLQRNIPLSLWQWMTWWSPPNTLRMWLSSTQSLSSTER